MEAKISVVIPVYNVEKYLRDCLDSVINQTLKEIEIICVNDGSTDGSLAILEEYAKKDGRIKIINQENHGLSTARNVGIENINSELCYFLDSDDYIEPDTLEYALKIFEKFDIDYFCFGSQAFVEGTARDEETLNRTNNYLKIRRDGLYELNFDIGLNTNIHVWNKVFKKSIIDEYNIRFPIGLLYEDIYFMWHYFFVSKVAYYDESIYHHYRIHKSSIMEKVNENKAYDTAIHHMYNWQELMLKLSKDELLFMPNYEKLKILLQRYRVRTKELLPAKDKYRVEEVRQTYLSELEGIKAGYEKKEDEPLPEPRYTFMERIFSIKNSPDKKRKVICLMGLKLKFRRGL